MSGICEPKNSPLRTVCKLSLKAKRKKFDQEMIRKQAKRGKLTQKELDAFWVKEMKDKHYYKIQNLKLLNLTKEKRQDGYYRFYS